MTIAVRSLDKTSYSVSLLLPLLPASNNKQFLVNWQEKFLGAEAMRKTSFATLERYSPGFSL
jgi:hypothetical protein